MSFLQKYSDEVRDFMMVCKRLADRMYVTSHGGNLSCKLEDNLILISPTCVCKSDVTEADVVFIDLEGKTVEVQELDMSTDKERARLGGVAHILGGLIQGQTDLETRVSSLGYVQRGGVPVAYDRSLATALGVKAMDGAKRIISPLDSIVQEIRTGQPGGGTSQIELLLNFLTTVDIEALQKEVEVLRQASTIFSKL